MSKQTPLPSVLAAICLSFALFCTPVNAAEQPDLFSDVPVDSWYYE